MATSRRDFLKKGSLVALVAGIPLGLAEKLSGGEVFASSSRLGLSKDAFQAQLNTQFSIKEGDRKILVRLAVVKDLRRGQKLTNKECFGLQFRGDQLNTLEQGTYLIEHDKLGTFSFLLVPIGNDRVPCYEAIVNHLNS